MSVKLPAVGTGDTTPLVSTDNVTADSTQVQNVQWVTVSGGVLARVTPLQNGGNVVVTGSALPTGASTETTLASVLTQLNTNTTNINQFRIGGQSVNLGAGVIGTGTQRVVLATDQAQLTNALKVDGSAVTQPVSATALPLPAGAATQTTLASLLAKTPAIGTAGSAATDVTTIQGIAGGTAVPVSGTFTANPAADISTSATITTSGTTTLSGLNGMSTLVLEILSNTAGGVSCVMQGTLDGTNWENIGVLNGQGGTSFLFTTFGNAAGLYLAPIAGFSAVRLNVTITSGSMGVNLRASVGETWARQVTVSNSVSTTSNVTQLGSANINLGSGGISTGTQRIITASSTTPTVTSVAASATSVSLLALTSTRAGATFYNEPGGAILYLKLGATASTTSYTIQVAPGGYYEVPFKYSGAIDGIWASASGNVRITELV